MFLDFVAMLGVHLSDIVQWNEAVGALFPTRSHLQSNGPFVGPELHFQANMSILSDCIVIFSFFHDRCIMLSIEL